MTYFKACCLGLDDLGCALLINDNDLTISAACGIVRRGRADVLKIRTIQVLLLRAIGAGLEYFWPGHCEGAIQGDQNRANNTLALLRKTL